MLDTHTGRTGLNALAMSEMRKTDRNRKAVNRERQRYDDKSANVRQMFGSRVFADFALLTLDQSRDFNVRRGCRPVRRGFGLLGTKDRPTQQKPQHAKSGLCFPLRRAKVKAAKEVGSSSMKTRA